MLSSGLPELAVAVGNHGQVGVFALRHRFGQLNIQRVRVRGLVGGVHGVVKFENLFY